MFKIFLNHQWKEFWRGRNQAAGIVSRIIMGLLLLYFLAIALALGFFMAQIIKEVFPGRNIISVFNGFILYYFLADFLMRMQLQDLPTLSIQPYLHLDVRRKTIVNFLNGKSLMSFFNLWPIILAFPFCFTQIATSFGSMAVLGYIVSIIGLMLFNNFLAMYLKRKATSNGWFVAVGVLVVLAFAALDYFKVISISAFSDSVFSTIALHPWISIIFPVLAIVMYLVNSRFLIKNLYIEELSKKEEAKVSTDYPLLSRFGETGKLAALELKLILRHKRSKSGLTMSFLFVLYGFFFYRPELIQTNSFGKMLFAAIFMTGIFQIVYGQFMYAWQSAHFDGLMANKIDFKTFIKAKFLIFTLAGSLITMITMFYGFMSWKLIVMHIAVYLYNIGFGTVIVLYFANFNRKRLDLSKKASFNWQGVGATQWILGFPLILIPFLIYFPFALNDKPYWGLISIGIFGLITLSMRDIWINLLTKLFSKKRYKIAEGFRE